MTQTKILVVDDEKDIVRLLTMRLRAAGYQVIAANDGQTAIQMASKLLPDLVILDVGMPCGDGHMVVRKLAQNAETLATPVIYLTARTSEADRTRAYKAGAVEYLTKPFKSGSLLTAVSRALSASGRRQQQLQSS